MIFKQYWLIEIVYFILCIHSNHEYLLYTELLLMDVVQILIRKCNVTKQIISRFHTKKLGPKNEFSLIAYIMQKVD